MSPPTGPRKRPYLRKHEVSWPESLDLEINAEVSRRVEDSAGRLSPHAQKRVVVRDAVSAYLAPTRVRDEHAATEIGPQLRAARRAARMSLRDAATAAGDISRATISQVETGRQQPGLPALRALAKVYDVVVVIDKHGAAVASREAEVRSDAMGP